MGFFVQFDREMLRVKKDQQRSESCRNRRNLLTYKYQDTVFMVLHIIWLFGYNQSAISCTEQINTRYDFAIFKMLLNEGDRKIKVCGM